MGSRVVVYSSARKQWLSSWSCSYRIGLLQVERLFRNKCSRQELNLVFDLRRVACCPAHSENMGGSSKSRVTRPGIEPGPTVSKTVMLSSTPASHIDGLLHSHKSRRLGSHRHEPLYKSGAFLHRATSAWVVASVARPGFEPGTSG